MAMQVVGITDDVTTCQCCGKPNLKRTIALQNSTDAGAEVVFYGSDCAARALLGRKSKSNSDIVIHQARALTVARRWIAEGHSPAVIVKGIANRFGYGVEHRPEKNIIRLWGVGPVIGTRPDGSIIFDTVELALA